MHKRSISICKSKWHHHQYKPHIKFYTYHTTTITGPRFIEPAAGSSMQLQIVKALRSGDRKKASHLLRDFGRRSRSLSVNDFVDIFKYCAQSPDPMFVMEIWRLMELKDININNTSSSLMTRALCKGACMGEAFSIMDFLGENWRFYPGLPLYNSVLSSCTKIQNLIQARTCLDLMEKQIIGKSEVTYTALLKLAVLQKNLPAVHIIWREYINLYSMSIIALRKFIWSFTRLGDLKSANRTLQQLVALATRENISIARTVYGKLYSTRLDIPVPANDRLGSTILDLRKRKHHGSCILNPSLYLPDTISAGKEPKFVCMDDKKAKNTDINGLNGQKHSLLMKVLRWSFNDIIHGCAKEKNYMLAWKLILQMQNLGLQPSSHTYDGIIRAVVSQRSFGDAMKMLKKMQQENLKLYDSTLATISVSFSRELQLDLAESLLNQISDCLYPHPYNALLAACDALNQPERAVRVFAKMRKIKLLPDMRTYELMFSLFGIVNAPYEDSSMLSQVDATQRINAIERDMANNGFLHSHRSLKNILRSLGEEGMIRKMIQYLDLAENLFIYSNPSLGTDMYNIALHYLVEAQESHMAIRIFKKMKKLRGCHPDSTTYNIMIDCCSVIRSYRSASLLISMMIREGFSPVACTYTTLIKILLEDENFNEALNVLERIKLHGIQLDVLLFNTFLRQACYKGRIDVIEYIVEFMHQEKVQPDPTTCDYVFSAYVNSSFHNTAIEAFQVLSLRMMSEDGNILKERRNFVDEFILDEDLASESHIFKLFEDSEDEVAIGLLNLRWCAIVGFPICESADQSLWAKRLESRFLKRLASGSRRESNCDS